VYHGPRNPGSPERISTRWPDLNFGAEGVEDEEGLDIAMRKGVLAGDELRGRR